MDLFLNEDNFWNKYSKSKEWTEKWSEDFDEFYRIARNEAPEGVPKQYANVSDGTTAALIRKTPKRVIQQLPTGMVTSDDKDDWLPIFADFILTNKILPFANSDYDLIQKFWTSVENGLAIGGQAVYTPFIKNNGEFTTDMSLIYYGDIFFQEGKKSLYACDYFFMRSWWQPEQVDQIIANETKMSAEAKKNGEAYETSWDLKALKELKKNISEKDAQAETASEKKAAVGPSGIEIITGFQKGIGAIFFTGSNGKIVRRKKNKDPRGVPPVDYFYADVDGSNPFGRSITKLVGGMQNMIDGDLRAYKFNRSLELAPPLLVYGNVDTTQSFYEADAIIEMGDDPNNKVEPLDVSTTAIKEYGNIYGLNKTQILNLFNSGGDTSNSVDFGNPGFGKTPEALKQQRAIMSSDDNFLRKNFESFFENWAETAINVYFAEREGVEDFQLDGKTADKLRQLEEKGKLPKGFVSDNNVIRVDFSSATPALHFHVDASTSKLNGQAEQLQVLQLLIQMAATPTLAQVVPMANIAKTWNKIVSNSGVEDPEDLVVDMEQFDKQDGDKGENVAADAMRSTYANVPFDPEQTDTTPVQGGAPQQQQQQQQQQSQPPMPPLDGPQTIADMVKTSGQPDPNAFKATPMEQLIPSSEPQLTEEESIAEELRKRGVPETLIRQAIDADKNGVPGQDILDALSGVSH